MHLVENQSHSSQEPVSSSPGSKAWAEEAATFAGTLAIGSFLVVFGGCSLDTAGVITAIILAGIIVVFRIVPDLTILGPVGRWSDSHELGSIIWPLLVRSLSDTAATTSDSLCEMRDTWMTALFTVFVEAERGSKSHLAKLDQVFFRTLAFYRFTWALGLTLGLLLLATPAAIAIETRMPAHGSVWVISAVVLFLAATLSRRILRGKLEMVSHSEVDELFDKQPAELRDRLSRLLDVPRALRNSRPDVSMIRDDGELECAVAEFLLTARNTVVLQYPEQLPDEGIVHVLPAFICCRSKGVQVHIVSARMTRRYQLLDKLGCTFAPRPHNTTHAETPLCAVVRDPFSENAGVLWTTSHADGSVIARRLEGPTVTALARHLAPDSNAANSMSEPPQLKPMKFASLRDRLRAQIPDYSNCKIELLNVDVFQTRPMTTQIRRVADMQLDYLQKLYEAAGIPLYKPAAIALSGGLFSPLIPPVLEYDSTNGTYRVHEGHTRVYRAWRLAYSDRQRSSKAEHTIWAVVVYGAPPLPADEQGPYEWNGRWQPVTMPQFGDTRWRHGRGIEQNTRTLPDSSNPTNRIWNFATADELLKETD